MTTITVIYEHLLTEHLIAAGQLSPRDRRPLDYAAASAKLYPLVVQEAAERRRAKYSESPQ